MRNRKGKLLTWMTWCVLAFCLSLLMASSARADMGPKPNVTIKIKNMPEQEFVLALLTKDDERGNEGEYTEDANDPYASMKKKIHDYAEDGWKLAHGPGGSPFMTNSVEGGLINQYSEGSARFTYYAPSNFKVMIVTGDGTQYVSNEVETTRFSAICIYDLTTGELTEDLETYHENDKQEYIGMAMLYLVGTIMVEGLVLILFGLSQARNLPIFLFANILTQAYMHVDAWLYEMRHGSGGMAGTIHYVIKEILIILVECVLYALCMKQENGKKLRIILYAIVANLVSMVTSLYVGGPLGTRILFFVFMIIAYGIVLIIHSRKEKNIHSLKC